MANDSNSPDLAVPNPDAGLGFRLEMAVTNFIYGYWRQMAVAAGVVLIVVLLYGAWRDRMLAFQKTAAGESARVLNKLAERYDGIKLPGQRGSALTAELPTMAESRIDSLLQPPVGPDSPKGQSFATAARELQAVSQNYSGFAAQEAQLYAAELYRLAGQPDQQQQALQAAADHGGELGALAKRALATLAPPEQRLAELLDLTTSETSTFAAQQASVAYMVAAVGLSHPDNARAELDRFEARWPDSAWGDWLERLRGQLGPGGTLQSPAHGASTQGGVPPQGATP